MILLNPEKVILIKMSEYKCFLFDWDLEKVVKTIQDSFDYNFKLLCKTMIIRALLFDLNSEKYRTHKSCKP